MEGMSRRPEQRCRPGTLFLAKKLGFDVKEKK